MLCASFSSGIKIGFVFFAHFLKKIDFFNLCCETSAEY